MGGFLFLNTLYLQTARGYSPLGWPADPAHGGHHRRDRAAVRPLVAAGRGRWALLTAGTAIAAGAAVLVTLTAATPVAELTVVYVVFGVGFGFVNPPISNTAMSGMPRAQAGVAASVASTSRQVGATLGVAVTGTLVAGRDAAGYTTASHAGWIVIGACGVTVVVTGLVDQPAGPPQRAAHP